ncbi:MAG TPA: hypothetical protein VOA87_12910 [Thermoanaerobaculia bacterium]|nr:hypothetical protein [Thermoanaerobaculia bacterium]
MKNHPSAALSLFFAVVLVLISALAGFVATHRSSRTMTAQAAAEQLARLRSNLKSQRSVGSDLLPVPVRAIHTVVFDTRGGGRLVRVDAPLWWVRIVVRDGKIRSLGQLTFFDDTEFDADPADLSLAQVARQGPALLADQHHTTGGQFVSWSD